MHVYKILVPLVAFRIINAVLCQTVFVPDEPWQSLEVAHRMVFGYGYLTWEWQEGIRGYTHPFIFAVLYKCLQLLGMDWPCLLIILPRLLQGVCAAVADLYLYQLTCKMFGRSVGNFTLLCYVFNWFTFYCVTRTLSNSLETILGVIGVYLLYHRSFTSGVVVAALSSLVRPTAAIFWIPVFILQFYWSNLNEKLMYAVKLVAVGCCALCWSMVVDRIFYGKWIFVQYEFLLFNVLAGKSALFGTHPWHWYFSQGVPTVLFTLFPSFFIGGLTVTNHKALYFTSLYYTVVHSALQHKEFRFIFPVVPFACIYAGHHLHTLWTKYRHWGFKCLVVLMLVSNIPMTIYFSLIHQRGSLTIMNELRTAIDDYPGTPSVLFLTQCHTTPYYRWTYWHASHSQECVNAFPHLLKIVCSVAVCGCVFYCAMHFILLVASEETNEAEEFFHNPRQWLSDFCSSHPELPTHLVMFDSLLPSVEPFLVDNHYRKVSEVFHAHFLDSETDGHYLQLYVKDNKNKLLYR